MYTLFVYYISIDAGGALFTIVCLMIAAAALGGLGIILHLSMPVGGICVLIAGECPTHNYPLV